MTKRIIKITKEFLEEHDACNEGKQWFLKQKSSSVSIVVNKLIKEKRFDWANWTITKMMTQQQSVRYACFAAFQLLQNFEKVFPNDKRPRQAIATALVWVDSPTKKNKLAAWSAESSSSAEAARSARLAAKSTAAWKKILIYGVKLIV